MRLVGVAGGLGTAIADGVYATLVAFGFATFSAILTGIDIPMRLAGGVFMLYLGWKTFQAKPRVVAATVSTRDLVGTTAATFLAEQRRPAVSAKMRRGAEVSGRYRASRCIHRREKPPMTRMRSQ